MAVRPDVKAARLRGEMAVRSWLRGSVARRHCEMESQSQSNELDK